MPIEYSNYKKNVCANYTINFSLRHELANWRETLKMCAKMKHKICTINYLNKFQLEVRISELERDTSLLFDLVWVHLLLNMQVPSSNVPVRINEMI